MQLSSLLADVGLNIREAHVFSTVDGYSLDVFVVDGWPTEVWVVKEFKIFLYKLYILHKKTLQFLHAANTTSGL